MKSGKRERVTVEKERSDKQKNVLWFLLFYFVCLHVYDIDNLLYASGLIDTLHMQYKLKIE